jgi:putative FmdB family regulatory protein
MIYEYKCYACDHTFERQLRLAEVYAPKSEPCPECGVTGKVDRHITTARIGDITVIYPFRAIGDFKHVLRQIHDKTYKSNLNSKF